MVKTRSRNRSRRTRRGGRTRRTRKGGNMVSTVLQALKQALPSYLLYQAVKVQQKRRRKQKTRIGGRKSLRGGRKSHRRKIR